LCLTNPPFGVKGGLTKSQQDHLDYPTSNKQLAFVQHVYKSLAPNGRAAIVVPDNVLFEFGVAASVRTKLLDGFDLHTVLRLPAGIFYATGVRTSVLFFRNLGTGTDITWFYDLRANGGNGFTKRRQLQPADLLDFVQSYGAQPTNIESRNPTERFKPVEREDLRATGDRLDLSTTEVRQHAGGSDSPIELADIIVRELEQAMTAARELSNILREAGDSAKS
jgi:type I restriction enzyme M protein